MESIYKLLEKYVLNEGRKEDVMAKYPNVPAEIIEAFVEGETLEPEFRSVWKSKDNKYLDWMVGVYEKGNVTVANIIDLVKNFYEKEVMMTKQNIDEFLQSDSAEEFDGSGVNLESFKKAPKDIRNFPNFNSLKIFLDYLNEKKSRAQAEKEVKQQGARIANGEYEGKKFIVISPTTYAASCQYGKYSQWCVATANTGHFYNYTKRGTLYFFIQTTENLPPITPKWGDRTRTQEANTPPFKTALLIEDNGETSWWSKSDQRYDGWVGSPGYEWFTQDIADKIMAYNKKAIETRKQREIERIMNSPGFYKRSGGDNTLKNDFNGLLKNNVFTNEQLIKIIENDNWLIFYNSSEDGDEVRKKLGPSTVYNILMDMFGKSSSIDESFTEILKDMDANKFFYQYANKNFSDEENKMVAEKLVKKLGKKPSASEIGSDAKMYVDKWTMKPEEMEQYNRTSNYFFLGTPTDIVVGKDSEGREKYKKSITIEDLTKVDRFDPNTHDSLTLMMYAVNKRTNKDPNIGLYAIVTDKNLLDDYIGAEEIPDSIAEMLLQKSKIIFGKK